MIRRTDILVTLILLLAGFSATAQLKVTAAGTNGTCQANASVQASTTGGVVPMSFELRNSAGTVIRPGQPDSNFTGLSPASYVVAVYDANHSTTPVLSNTVNVTSSYTSPSLSSVQGSTQATLPFTCTSNTTAGNVWMYWASTGKAPYTLSVLSGPVSPAPVVVSTGTSGYITGLSSGNYVVSLTDACNTTVSSNTVSVVGTASVYPPTVPLSLGYYAKSTVTTCDNGLDIYISTSSSLGVFATPVRMYAEFPAGSGNFTDTVTNNLFKIIFPSQLTPAQLNNVQYNVWAQQPCTGAWQKSTFTVPDNSMIVSSGSPAVGGTSNCDSIVRYVTVSFPRSNPMNTSALYCYPIRFTVANASAPSVILKDSTINSGGFYQGNAFYQPTASGTYIVTLTDAGGYTEQASVVITAQSPQKLSYSASLTATDCSLSTQVVQVAGNGFLKNSPYPVTLKLLSVTGISDLSAYQPITVSSYPNTNNWISLWTLPVLANNANISVIAEWSCPRNDTATVWQGYIQHKYPYKSIKLDSSWVTIGSAGCSGGRANLGIRLTVKDTLGNTVSNGIGSFLVKVLSPTGINPIYVSAGLTQNAFSSLSPGTYKIVVAPNLPPYGATPVTCQYWDTVSVVIPNFGVPVIDANKTYGIVCPGQSTGTLTVVVNGYPPFKYAIRQQGASSFGNQQSSNVFTGLTPGYYDVQVQDGCNNIVTQTVQVINVAANSLLTVTGASSSGAVCEGGKVVLKVKPIGPVSSITWTLPGGATVSNIDSLVVENFEAANAGNYAVVVTSAAGCTIPDSRRLSLAAPANLVITNPPAICAGDSVDLTLAAITAGSSNITGLEYYVNAAATVALQNPSKAKPATTTTYYIKATSPDGCVAIKPVTVTVNSLPVVPAISGETGVCKGSTITLTNTIPGGVWSSDQVSIATINASGVITGVAAGSANITYTVTDDNGCRSNASKAIDVLALPVKPTVSGASTLCLGSAKMFSANAAGGLWSSDNSTVASINASGVVSAISIGTANIIYTVSSADGCFNADSVSLTVNGLPAKPVISNGALNVCAGASTTFTATPAGGTWNVDNSSATIDQSGKFTGNIAGSTHVIYTVTNAGTGCFSRDTVLVQVNSLPTVTAISSQESCADNSGTNTSSPVVFSGTLSGTVFNWTMDKAIGFNLSGSDNIPAFAYNLPAGSAATTSTVTVTPVAEGCSGSPVKFTYTLNPYPQVSANVNDGSQCLQDNNFIFTNTSSIPGDEALSYEWNFDDGTKLTTPGASHVFAAAGPHTYTLKASSMKGCSKTISGSVAVKPDPVASFIYAITSPNTNDSYSFTNTSTSSSGIAGMNYYWNFGDETSSALQNPDHIYASDGTYTVSLTVTSEDGCPATTSQTIIVNKDPNIVAGFTINKPGQCITGNSFVFTNTSTAANGASITAYAWDFGDGATSSASSPTHTYSAPDAYTVTLKIKSSTGFEDIVTQSVNVYGMPDVNKPSDQSVCNEGSTNAIIFTSNNGGPVYTWTNNSASIGLSASGTGDINSFKAINTGAAPVTASIVVTPSQNGCAGASQNFTIMVNPTPDVEGYASQLVCSGTSVAAEDFASNVPGAGFNWINDNPSIGLAVNGNSNITSFTAENTGNAVQVATIQVTPRAGACYGTSKSFTITVNPVAKLSSSHVPPAVCSGSTFGYTPSATLSNTTYSWSRAAVAGIEEGASSGTDLISEMLTNTTNNPITVSYAFVLTSPEGCKSEDTVKVVVNPFPEVAAISPVNACSNATIHVPAFSGNVSNTSYFWTNSQPQIGLQASGNGNLPSFTAMNNTNEPLVATVAVVPSAYNCVGTPQSFTITVNPTVAVAAMRDTSVCEGSLITLPQFKSTSASGTVYTWTVDQNIGLPLSGTGNLPAFVASTPTDDYITANITVNASIGGCYGGSNVYKVKVNPVPKPAFAINNTTQCQNGNTFVFTNQSAPSSGLNYAWSFGDGAFNTNQANTQTHSYAAEGTYAVKLTAQVAGSGCDAVSLTKNIQVNATPNAAFVYVLQSPNTNDQYAFTSKSTISNGSVKTYLWDFGDGETSTIANPEHRYSTGGTFAVTLTVTSDKGCPASTVQYIVVTKDPNLVAGFTVNDATQCLAGNAFLFTNATSIANGAIITGYTWDFGDGTTTVNTPDASHTYLQPGTYIVSLTATTTNGFSDVVTQSVTVYPIPAMTKPKDTTVCSGSSTSTIRFNGVVQGTTFNWSNNNPSIGLASSGSGTTIAPFVAANSTNGPVSAVITVVPAANGCTGAAEAFTIKVNPSPTVSGYSSQVVCAGNEIAAENFTGNVSGTSFTWTNDNLSTGILASGVNSIAPLTAVNDGTVPEVSNISVIPSANGCTGAAGHFSITVNPQPELTSTTNAGHICSGATFNYTPESNMNNVVFRWNRAAVAGISNPAANGTGDPNEVLINNSSQPVVVTYVYTLESNDCPGAASYQVKLTVDPLPSLSSTLTPPAICNNGRFDYMPESNTPGASFAWTRAADAYNSAGSGQFNPLEILHNGGATPLTVTYIYSISANSCVNGSQTVKVVVNPDPTDDFTFSGPQCLKDNHFEFALNPNSGAAGYSWSFGDGSTATGTSPSHTYAVDGVYPVSLTAVSGSGCSHTVTHNVIVNPSPVAQFIYASIAPNSNDQYQFTDKSIIGSGSIAGYTWDFGDGNTSSFQHPTHTYVAGGTYTVSLTITSNLGCSATVTETLVINKDPNITADFTINNAAQCISGNTFSFTDETTAAAGITITGYSWDFGDGSPLVNLQNPKHNYATDGTYIVRLHVTGTNGTSTFTDDITQSVIVFTTPDMQQPGNQVVCNQSSSSPIFFDPSEPGIGFAWTMNTDIGDGTSGAGNILSFVANNNTRAPIVSTVIVTPEANGCSGASRNFTITVNPTPDVSGYRDQTICANEATAATDFTGSVAGTSFAWINDNTSTGIASAGNGNISSVTAMNAGVLPNISHIFVTPSANGCDGVTQTFAITVDPQPVMTSDLNGGEVCSGTEFNYTPESSSAGAVFNWSRAVVAGISNPAATGTGSPDESLINTTTSPVTVTYVYTVAVGSCTGAGTYNVTVVVNPAPVLSSNTTAPAICSGKEFDYLPTSNTPGAIFAWSRAVIPGISNAAANGVGNPKELLINSTPDPVTVTYAYTLSANGCTGAAQNVQVVVNPSPVADYLVDNASLCFDNNQVRFTDKSSIGSGTLAYLWDFDDGTTATAQDVTHAFALDGVYNVKLTTTSNSGCVASATKSVSINPLPLASFTYNVIVPGGNDQYQFVNLSNINPGTLSYVWDFGDGQQSSDVSPVHTYGTAGTYIVTLAATSDKGCTAIQTQIIIVVKDPNVNAGFTINNAAQCLSANSFRFTNTTTWAPGTGTPVYQWNFGDNTAVSNDVNPVHTYASPGSYTVTLTATGDRGYTSVVTASILVSASPVVDKPANQVVCAGTVTENINFTGGANGTGYKWINDRPDIGLPASGAGDIASFTAMNSTGIPVVANITVTPDVNGCTGVSSTFTITVDPLPEVAPVVSQSVCAGALTDTVHFSANVAGAIFKWSNNNSSVGLVENGIGNINGFTALNSGNTTNSAVITVTATASGCESLPQSFGIDVKPVPALISADTASAICDSALFSYTPSANVPGSIFTWTRAAVNGISNLAASGTGNPDEILKNATNLPVQVVYRYTLNAGGCTDMQDVFVTVNPRPALTSTVTPDAICNQTVFSYLPESTTPGTTFRWTRGVIPGISNTAASGTENPNEILNNITASPIRVNYNYLLSANGCYNTYTVGVTVDPQPALSSTVNPTAVCSGTMFTYEPESEAGGATFTWTRASVPGISNAAASGTGSIAETLINTTTLPVNVAYLYNVSYNACSLQQKVTVTVNPAPALSTTLTDQVVCAGQNTNAVPLTGTVPGTIYNWSNSNSAIGLQNEGSGTIPSFVAKNQYGQPISATVAVNPVTSDGCTVDSSLAFDIVVNAVPDSVIVAPHDTIICDGSSLPLIATGGDAYQWYKDGAIIPGATSSQLIVNEAGTYSVAASTFTGCSIPPSGNQRITVVKKPKANFTYSGYCQNLNITFVSTSDTVNSGSVIYQWRDDAGHSSNLPSPVFAYHQPGNYTMTLKIISEGCAALTDSISKPITIQVPVTGVRLPTVNTVANAPTQLHARSFDTTSYLWSPATGLSSITVQDPLTVLSADQQYVVAMTMPSLCVTTDTLLVRVLGNDLVYIPNVITPNGDGKNDKLVIVGLERYPGSEIIIFNRWQNKVYESHNYSNDWDAAGLNAGTYFYTLRLHTSNGVKVMNGWITVLRQN